MKRQLKTKVPLKSKGLTTSIANLQLVPKNRRGLKQRRITRGARATKTLAKAAAQKRDAFVREEITSGKTQK